MIKANGSTVASGKFHHNAARTRAMQLEIDAATGTAPNQAPSHYIRKRLYGLGATLEVNYIDPAGVGATPSWDLAPIGGVRIYGLGRVVHLHTLRKTGSRLRGDFCGGSGADPVGPCPRGQRAKPEGRVTR